MLVVLDIYIIREPIALSSYISLIKMWLILRQVIIS